MWKLRLLIKNGFWQQNKQRNIGRWLFNWSAVQGSSPRPFQCLPCLSHIGSSSCMEYIVASQGTIPYSSTCEIFDCVLILFYSWRTNCDLKSAIKTFLVADGHHCKRERGPQTPLNSAADQSSLCASSSHASGGIFESKINHYRN